MISNKKYNIKIYNQKSSHAYSRYLPIYILSFIIFCFLFTGCVSSGPEGVYYVGTNEDNCAFISFSPPNDYHDDFITWTGNKRNGVRNCETKANYIYNRDSKTITISGFYNSNCSSISSRNGTWKIDGSKIISPSGTTLRKQ